jgi:hypothetical protein
MKSLPETQVSEGWLSEGDGFVLIILDGLIQKAPMIPICVFVNN